MRLPDARRAFVYIFSLCFGILVLSASPAAEGAVTFTEVGTGLPGSVLGAVEWGDYDNDGDLDLVLSGAGSTGDFSRIYRNDGGGAFADIAAGLIGVENSAAAWGDYDADGDLDLVLAGRTSSYTSASRIYRNEGGGAFVDVAAGLAGVDNGAVAWGDYDNDGDLDLALSGAGDSYTGVATIYRNDGGSVFVDIASGFPGVQDGDVDWGDYDGDGDLDLVLTGGPVVPVAAARDRVPDRLETGPSGAPTYGEVSIVYRNDGGGGFTDIGAALPGVQYSTSDWGDFDGDGDLDLALGGYPSSGTPVASVYRNDGGGTFTDILPGLAGVEEGCVAWGDYDNDGDLDLVLTGNASSYSYEPTSRIYRNDGGAFVDTGAGLTGIGYSAVAWGDYDADGDLDLVLSGADDSYDLSTLVYRNDGAPANTIPSAPGNLSSSVSGTSATFSWDPASDGETPAAGLSYNLWVGTGPATADLASPMADLATGYRRVVRLGNAGGNTSWTLHDLPLPGSLHWSVQSVDAAFAGSPFAAPQAVGSVPSVVPEPEPACITPAAPCNTVSFAVDRTEATPMRAFSVSFSLSGELSLCAGDPGDDVQEGNYLGDVGSTAFQVVDLGGGSYTVDGAILGLPCGATAAAGTLFTVDVTGAVPVGTGTVTVDSLLFRDCDNQPIAATAGGTGIVDIDTEVPSAIAGLAATQVKSGNDGDGTTQVALAWTPVGAPGADSVEIYRAPFGQYPEYDDAGGSVPAVPVYPPGGPWTPAGTVPATMSGFTDEPPVRDFWYYAAFVTDACGNVSAVSNVTGGTLNYHLGDVRPFPGPGGPPYGDNTVGLLDISALGAHYGTEDGDAAYTDTLDVGPTSDGSVDGLPVTDNAIQFEDLILIAINYGQVSKPGMRPAAAERNAVALEVPEDVTGSFQVAIRMASTGEIQGMSVPLRWNGEVVEPAGMVPGEVLDRQAGPAVALSPRPGTVDVAVFGGTLTGEGELARVEFRRIAAGAPGIGLGDVEARDGANRKVALATEPGDDERALATRLLPGAPNPFRKATMVRFTLERPGPVRVEVYGLDGRLVRRLAWGTLPAGEHRLIWDGRDESGREAASGVYLIRFRASGRAASRRVIRLR